MQTKKLDKANNKIDYLKDILKSHKGRLTGEAVKDSNILMLYFDNDEDNYYIKIVRAQTEYLKGRDKRIFENKQYLFLSYLPEAINQNKEILNEILNKKKYKNIMSMNTVGGKTKINIDKVKYLKKYFADDYKEFSEKKIKRKLTYYANDFINSYENELKELIESEARKEDEED